MNPSTEFLIASILFNILVLVAGYAGASICIMAILSGFGLLSLGVSFYYLGQYK